MSSNISNLEKGENSTSHLLGDSSKETSMSKLINKIFEIGFCSGLLGGITSPSFLVMFKKRSRPNSILCRLWSFRRFFNFLIITMCNPM